MKNILSKITFEVQLIIIIILAITTVSCYNITEYFSKYDIEQEVSVLPFNQQVRHYEIWEAINGDSKEPNPFDLDKTCYVLETKLGDDFEYDYGTEAVILAKKCERYAEFEKNHDKLIADRDSIELAIEKTKQAQEDALDRLNEKSCN
jgi:hypothetical protein